MFTKYCPNSECLRRVQCVDSASKCTHLYVVDDYQMCVDDYACRSGLTYIDGGTRKCVTSSKCTDPSFIDGYVTPYHRCVSDCSGRYKKGEGRTCVCEATSSGACSEDCPSGYIRAWVYGDCVLRTECLRIYLVDDEEVCLN